MFEGEWTLRWTFQLPSFGRLVDKIHDYVWEPEDEDE